MKTLFNYVKEGFFQNVGTFDDRAKASSAAEEIIKILKEYVKQNLNKHYSDVGPNTTEWINAVLKIDKYVEIINNTNMSIVFAWNESLYSKKHTAHLERKYNSSSPKLSNRWISYGDNMMHNIGYGEASKFNFFRHYVSEMFIRSVWKQLMDQQENNISKDLMMTNTINYTLK